MRIKSYCINIPPISWQRARICGKKFYDNQTHQKLAVGLYMKQQHGDEPLFASPISIDISFFMPIPKCIKNRSNSEFHSTTPDLDNLCKFLLDTMKDIIIADDKFICRMFVEKIYHKQPRTEFTIKEVDPTSPRLRRTE